MEQKDWDGLVKLLRDDMKPALGVTEPGAIAFAAAKAREFVKGDVERVDVVLNSGMYKNAFTCGIPHSDAVGNAYAAALGVVAGDAALGWKRWRRSTTKRMKRRRGLSKGKGIRAGRRDYAGYLYPRRSGDGVGLLCRHDCPYAYEYREYRRQRRRRI